MNSLTKAFGKLCVIVLPPLLLMGGSFFLFKLLRDTYTAEARISLQATSETVSTTSDSELSAQQWDCMHKTSERLLTDSCLQLSCLALTISDLKQEPGRPERSLSMGDDKRELALNRLPALSGNLRALNPDVPDSLIEVMAWLGYTPDALRRRLVVRPIPQTQQIRVQASAPSPEFSMYLANSFSRISCNFLIHERRNRLHATRDSLLVADSMARVMLKNQEMALSQARVEAYGDSSAQSAREAQERIAQLELKQVQLKRQLEIYRSMRPGSRKPRRTTTVKVSDHPSPPSEWDVSTRVAELANIDAEILALKKQLLSEDSVLLKVYYEELSAYQQTLDSLKHSLDLNQAHISQLPQHLQFTLADRSRLPSPLAAYGLSLLVGWAAFLTWILFLFQVKYLRWPLPVKH